jgi:glutamine amidotransferase
LVCALVTASIRGRAGDVGAGLVDAVGWLADNVPIYALNLLLCTATDMWALRYPDTHELLILDRRHPADHLRFELSSTRISARSQHLAGAPSVVFATERMDDDPGWQPLGAGELVHVGPDLRITRATGFAQPPRHQLSIADLSAVAAAGQSLR